MRRIALLAVFAPLLAEPAGAWQRCQYFTDGREPRCLVQSDGRGQPYLDGRRHPQASRPSVMAEALARRRMMMRARAAQANRMQEGAQHTQDMRTGGTPSSVGVISPFVPGSDQDRGWQLERKRRVLCGNDPRCLNAR